MQARQGDGAKSLPASRNLARRDRDHRVNGPRWVRFGVEGWTWPLVILVEPGFAEIGFPHIELQLLLPGARTLAP